MCPMIKPASNDLRFMPSVQADKLLNWSVFCFVQGQHVNTASIQHWIKSIWYYRANSFAATHGISRILLVLNPVFYWHETDWLGSRGSDLAIESDAIEIHNIS